MEKKSSGNVTRKSLTTTSMEKIKKESQLTEREMGVELVEQGVQATIQRRRLERHTLKTNPKKSGGE